MGATRATIIGFAAPETALADLERQDVFVKTQTQNFIWSFISGLVQNGFRVDLLSFLPASNFPDCRQILFRSRPFEEEGIQGQLMGYINLILLKHASRFLQSLRFGMPWLRLRKSEIVFVHTAHSPILLFAAVARKVRGVKVVAILTDPPSLIRPEENRLVGNLKQMDVWMIRKALAQTDGVIALTEALGADFAPGKPRLILEGILNPKAGLPLTPTAAMDPAGTFTFAYSGTLYSRYGVRRLVEAFRLLPQGHLRLNLIGKGDLDPWIHEQTGHDPRISHLGFVDYPTMLWHLRQAQVLVNPRPVDEDFVKYSFPSKTLDYLAMGVPVLSTRLPGIPAEYEDKILHIEHDSIEGIRLALEQCQELPAEVLAEYAARGQAFVMEKRNAARQGRRVRAFIDQLMDGSLEEPEKLSPGHGGPKVLGH